jgi:RimJ/RimL family protein N-acetyltransferase
MIKGKLCALRHLRQEDIEPFLRLTNNLEIRGPHFPSQLRPPEQFQKDFDSHGFVTEEFERMLIVDLEDRIIGDIGHFQLRGKHVREIGYILFEPAARGRGYTSEAVMLLVDYLFRSQHHLHRLELMMAVDNLGSERVAQKCGFTKEGTLRQRLFFDGRFVDGHLYSLLRGEWENRREARLEA